jgi:transposase
MISELEALTKIELNAMPRRRLEEFAWQEKEVIAMLKKDLEEAILQNSELKSSAEQIEELLMLFRKMLFAQSSEKSPTDRSSANSTKGNSSSPGNHGRKLPSERYPNVAIVEKLIAAETAPECPLCGDTMQDSGLREVTEQLNVVPRQFEILRLQKVKYRCCGCHQCLVTLRDKRICPGSSFSDDFIIDVAISKYNDLVPIERYCEIAERDGLIDLAPHTLIGLTHKLAEFLMPAIALIKKALLAAAVLHADETPHRMLEGDKKQKWYLWGFCDGMNSYFEIHDTRSGEVASEFLEQSTCHTIVSDVYSGYAKAVRIVNAKRPADRQIFNAYCHAHSRRRFVEALSSFPEEAEKYIKIYQAVYKIEAENSGMPIEVRAESRLQIGQQFQQIIELGNKDIEKVSTRSSLASAIGYFIDNFQGLSRCVHLPEVPLDNNLQERELRRPVIGRKTWYGTHSKLGAETAARLFTVTQTCRLCGVNPREYISAVVKSILNNGPPFTPWEFKQMQAAQMN